MLRRKNSPTSTDEPDVDPEAADDVVDDEAGVVDAVMVDAVTVDAMTVDADAPSGVLARPQVQRLTDARLLFDCGTWDRDSRADLDAALGERSIDRVWQGPELVVGLLDEHLVEEALTDLGVGEAHLPAGADQVVYEVGEWPRVLRDSLAESLLVAGIDCGWDDLADLHVAAADEDAVDAIVEAMPDPDEVFEEAEGTEVQDLLTQLYAAVDRLKDSPKIPGARLDVVEAAERMDRLAVPFGFDAGQWRDLVERAGDLRDEIDADVVASQQADEADETAGTSEAAGSDETDVDEATLGEGDVDDGSSAEPSDSVPARLPFAERAGQLRNRLVRLV